MAVGSGGELGGELGQESFVPYFRSFVFFNFRSFFLSHACMLSNFFLFLILEKHGNENNSSAALDIKMKDN